MTKQVLIFLSILLSVSCAFAQSTKRTPYLGPSQFTGSYNCVVEVSIRDKFGNASSACLNKFDMYANYNGSPSDQIEWYQFLNPIATSFKDYSHSFTFDAQKQLTSLRFYAERRYLEFTGCPFNCTPRCRDASGSGESKTTVIPSNPLPATTWGIADGVIPAYESIVSATVSPDNVNIYYIDPENSLLVSTENAVIANTGYLPSENHVTLRAFPEARYTWEIFKGGSWIPLPAGYQDRSSINIQGLDVFTEAQFLNLLRFDEAVQIRVKYNGTPKNTITLQAMLSSPKIINITPAPESCFNYKDGDLLVCFSRPLRDSELISIFLNEENPDDGLANITAFDGNNCFSIKTNGLRNLAPGTYPVSLIGSYLPPGKILPPNESLPKTFTDSPEHKRTETIVAASAVNLNTPVVQDVRCHEGEDGRISITALGGARNYTAYLLTASDTIQQIALSEDVGNSFVNVKAGTYTVKLKDSNLCDPQGGPQSIIVTQPEKPVFVDLTGPPTEPRGFGLTDGKITVRSQYGTMPYTFAWMDATSGNSLDSNPPVTEDGSMTSTLPDIGRGKYFVRVQDKNYDLAFPKTEANLRGCYDTLTVFVDEPPLLEVELKEHHFVSCYGKNDGELVAHAKGGRPYIVGQPFHPYQYEWFELDNNSLVAFGGSDSIAVKRPSSWYRIKVTDRNGIIAWSDDFHLIQPQPLKVSFNTSNLLCNGDTNGKSTALVTGGTQPYRYAWSTDDDTPAIENLPEGRYSVIIADDRTCTTFGQTQVEVPNGLTITPTPCAVTSCRK